MEGDTPILEGGKKLTLKWIFILTITFYTFSPKKELFFVHCQKCLHLVVKVS